MRTAITLAAAALLAAACGTAAAQPAAHPSRPPAGAGTPAVSLTAAQQKRECASLALVQMGYGSYAEEVRVVAGEYSVSQHDAELIIARAIRDRCPAEISVIPPGDPLP